MSFSDRTYGNSSSVEIDSKRPQSARFRPPSGGANNMNNNSSNNDGNWSPRILAGSMLVHNVRKPTRPSTADVAEKARKLQMKQKQGIVIPLPSHHDPLSFHRPFTPQAREYTCQEPYLPPSRYPTLPDENVNQTKWDARKAKLKPPVCPQSWLDKGQEKGLNEKLDFKVNVNNNMKADYAESFIEEHRDRMKLFNPAYEGKTPRHIRNHMIEQPNFARLMIDYSFKEKKIRLASSDNVRASLNFGNSNSLGEIQTDPNLACRSIAHNTRDLQRLKLLKPATSLAHMNGQHRRGYNHVEEYGNFSQFSGTMAKNRGCSLDR